MAGLERLERWYLTHCNGDWEHQSGVTIETLDNPGWRVTINLAGTEGESKTLETIRQERTPTDWVVYWIENRKFNAACGPANLSEIIDIFCDWFETSA